MTELSPSTPWMTGAEMILLSSTTATRHLFSSSVSGPHLVSPSLRNASRVSAVHLSRPELEKSSETTRRLVFCSICGEALEMSVPATFETSSRYLAPCSQATACLSGWLIEPGGRLSSWSQVTCGTLNCT